MIDIICYYDNHQEILYDTFFLPTYNKYLASNFNLLSTKFKSRHQSSFYESDNWCEIVINRFDILKDYIKRNNSKWAIFSDIDILFLGDITDYILKSTLQDRVDIFYMSETSRPCKWYINGGFFLFKCTDYIYDFFDRIQSGIRLMPRPNDQILIQSVLRELTDFKNYILDPNIFVANNRHFRSIIPLIRKKQIRVFHATSTATIISKIQVLSTAYFIHSTVNAEKNNLDCGLWIDIEEEKDATGFYMV